MTNDEAGPRVTITPTAIHAPPKINLKFGNTVSYQNKYNGTVWLKSLAGSAFGGGTTNVFEMAKDFADIISYLEPGPNIDFENTFWKLELYTTDPRTAGPIADEEIEIHLPGGGTD
jgi:hypothetical protein